MSDKVIIEGTGAYDGEFDLVMDFTNWELHQIKQWSGLRAGELEEAFAKGDNDLVVAVAAISVERSGRFGKVDITKLWNASVGSIQLRIAEGDAPPLSQAGPPSSSGSDELSEAPSGDGSDTGSGSLPSDPSPTGSRGSDPGSLSPLEISAV